MPTLPSLTPAAPRSWSLGWRRVALGPAVLVYSALLVFLRGRPSLSSDAGIFVSVAARLIHGDRLYTGVWDNKPPFFYYTQALAFGVAGWRGPFLLDVVWLTIAAASMWLLLRAVGASTLTAAAGAVAYPLLLTGAWYYAGYAELPPLALAPAVGWLWTRHRPFATGALLGVVPFFRPDYALVFLALIAAGWAVRPGGWSEWRRDLTWLVAGFLATVAAAIALLAARGELTGYIDTMRANFGYPNRTLDTLGEHHGVVGHVLVVTRSVGADALRLGFLAFVGCALAALGLIAVRRRRAAPRAPRGRPEGALVAPLVATAASAALTLALTALWPHDVELLALPAAFVTCVFVATLERSLRGVYARLAGAAVTIAVCLLAFGGLSRDAPGSPELGQPVSDWWHTPLSPSAIALDRAAVPLRIPGRSITYARLGQNHDDGHAAFIAGDLALACPIFQQYPFSVNLAQALACIRMRRPQLVLVGPFFSAYHLPLTRRWDSFVSASEQLLRTRYTEAVAMPDGGGTVEVWRLR